MTNLNFGLRIFILLEICMFKVGISYEKCTKNYIMKTQFVYFAYFDNSRINLNIGLITLIDGDMVTQSRQKFTEILD
jgi:hypothetical protein